MFENRHVVGVSVTPGCITLISARLDETAARNRLWGALAVGQKGRPYCERMALKNQERYEVLLERGHG
jgi:hypothetical protein